MKAYRIAIVAMLAGAACGGEPRPDDQLTGSIDSAAWSAARDLPAGVREALDSGNAAVRAGDHEEAKRLYLRAIELGPEESAGWFGLSMAERQLGNIAAADSAMQRVRELTPGASLIEERADTAPALHP